MSATLKRVDGLSQSSFEQTILVGFTNAYNSFSLILGKADGKMVAVNDANAV